MDRLKLDMLAILESERAFYRHEQHQVRVEFITIIIQRLGIDERFDSLIRAQLDLFVGRVDPRTFVDFCNSPRHAVRNAMLAWEIDHPTKGETNE